MGAMARILVIDDEEDVRTVMKGVLQSAGHEVACAADGEQGLASLRRTGANLVLTDILMPEKDGLEVIMYLQRESPLTKCVAISAPSNRVFLQSAQLLGATRVVEKPFTAAEIEAAVREVLS